MAKIYVDGSYCPITKTAGIGVTRKSISLSIKTYGSLAAEIIAMIKGAEVANKGDTIISDCLVIVNAIKRDKLLVRHEHLCMDCFSLFKQKKLKVVWVKREKNRKADKLATMGRKSNGC